MCQRVFISSNKKIAEVKDDLAFSLGSINSSEEEKQVHGYLGLEYVYEARSFMGCGCGLSFDEEMKSDPEEEYEKRVKDVLELKKLLIENGKDNKLLLVMTWEPYKILEFPKKNLNPNIITENRCDIEEDVVYQIVL